MPKGLAILLKQAETKGYENGVWEGLQFGLDITAIALHNKLGIGKKRLTALTAEVQSYIDEIVDLHDPEHTKIMIDKALSQIK